jgi:glycosyltransferase involved in cell wall biosynthesis
MRILVFADRLDFGGTQVNAIELTAALRDLHGHEVVLFATPGPMVALARKKGLRYLPAPHASTHPSLARMRALSKAVRQERPDLIHVWDWTQCLDAYYGVYLLMRVPMVVSVMSMGVPRILPMTIPATFGTPELLDQARAAGRKRLELIVPPVDVHQNAPDAVVAQPFRERYGLDEKHVVIVTVSRLVEWMKAESLRRTIDAVRKLGRHFPLKFVIVGDGTSRAELERLAHKTNEELGRAAVVLTGALLDPRPAYAAADIFVGMGGAALRAMAFAKPVIVVGEQGFSEALTPETAEAIYYRGIYGIGDGSPDNARLITHVRGLLERLDQLPSLGQFSRYFVLRSFALETVSARLARFFLASLDTVPRFHVAAADGLRTAAVGLGGKLIPNEFRCRPKACLATTNVRNV